MRTQTHALKIVAAATILAALTTTSAMATQTCISQTIDGGTHTETYISGMSGGGSHNGSDYTKATFCPVAAAAGTCTGESLSEPVAGPVYATKVVDNPDIDQKADLNVKATVKAVAAELLAAFFQNRPVNPVAPIYKPWVNGSCN